MQYCQAVRARSTLSSAVNPASLTVDTSGYLATADAPGDCLNLPAGGTLSVRAASATIDCPLDNSGTLTIICSDAMALDGADSGSGATCLASGTLDLGNGTALSSGDLTVDGTLDLEGDSIAVSGLWGSGLIRSSGGPATLSVGSDGETTTFDGILQDGSGGLALFVTGGNMLCLAPGARKHVFRRPDDRRRRDGAG